MMAISNRDREILLRQINRLLLDTPTFEVGDVAWVIEDTGTSLRKGSVATVTKVLTENKVAVTTRHYNGQEGFGVIPNNQLQKVKPLGEDSNGDEVNLYDLVEGIGNQFHGELMMVVGVDEDGVGIAHPVKIRLKPTVETHIDSRISLDKAKLTSMEEWCKPRLGDIVEFTDTYIDEFGYMAPRGSYGTVVEDLEHVIYVSNTETQIAIFDDKVKTVLRK